MGINVNADMNGIGNYIGTIEGILQAIADPRFEGDFVEHMMDSIETNFMTESIAARDSGNARIAHVFEWGENQGDVSTIPLFRLTRAGAGNHRALSYVFLPSTQQVPLPDPERYGFDPKKLQYLRRHVFQLKALVMETKRTVTIAPVGAKRLFIPSEKAKRGYYMTSKSTKIRPGGAAATGGFANWWNLWFGSRAEQVIGENVAATEKWLVATGAKYVRYAAGTSIGGIKVGGQFAAGKVVSTSYVNSKAASVKRKVQSDSKAFFNEDAYWATWDD